MAIKCFFYFILLFATLRAKNANDAHKNSVAVYSDVAEDKVLHLVQEMAKAGATLAKITKAIEKGMTDIEKEALPAIVAVIADPENIFSVIGVIAGVAQTFMALNKPEPVSKEEFEKAMAELHDTISDFRQEFEKAIKDIESLLLELNFRAEVYDPIISTFNFVQNFASSKDEQSLQELVDRCKAENPIGLYPVMKSKVADIIGRTENKNFRRDIVDGVFFSFLTSLLMLDICVAHCKIALFKQEGFLQELADSPNVSATILNIVDKNGVNGKWNIEIKQELDKIPGEIDAMFFPRPCNRGCIALNVVIEILKEHAGSENNGQLAKRIRQRFDTDFPGHFYFVVVYDNARGKEEHFVKWTGSDPYLMWKTHHETPDEDYQGKNFVVYATPNKSRKTDGCAQFQPGKKFVRMCYDDTHYPTDIDLERATDAMLDQCPDMNLWGIAKLKWDLETSWSDSIQSDAIEPHAVVTTQKDCYGDDFRVFALRYFP